jgi:hypothetical protein
VCDVNPGHALLPGSVPAILKPEPLVRLRHEGLKYLSCTAALRPLRSALCRAEGGAQRRSAWVAHQRAVSAVRQNYSPRDNPTECHKKGTPCIRTWISNKTPPPKNSAPATRHITAIAPGAPHRRIDNKTSRDMTDIGSVIKAFRYSSSSKRLTQTKSAPPAIKANGASHTYGSLYKCANVRDYAHCLARVAALNKCRCTSRC